MDLDLKSLVNKLNPTCRRALEGAAQMCMVGVEDSGVFTRMSRA